MKAGKTNIYIETGMSVTGQGVVKTELVDVVTSDWLMSQVCSVLIG